MNIEQPKKFIFSTNMDIHISYINYGDHLGNDSFISLMHEARIRFLNSLGCTERNIEGRGIIVKTLSIEYKKQVYHGDSLVINIGISKLSKASITLYYVGYNKNEECVMEAETTIVFFDYEKQKIVKTPELFCNMHT